MIYHSSELTMINLESIMLISSMIWLTSLLSCNKPMMSIVESELISKKKFPMKSSLSTPNKCKITLKDRVRKLS